MLVVDKDEEQPVEERGGGMVHEPRDSLSPKAEEASSSSNWKNEEEGVANGSLRAAQGTEARPGSVLGFLAYKRFLTHPGFIFR